MTEPIAPPTAASFLEGAEKYIEAACILIEKRTPIEPIGLLASHGLELALKAFLLHSGISPRKLKRDYGHDLQQLWRKAVAEGLGIERDPWWLALLNHYYDAPYQFRYPQEGFATPLPDGEEFPRELRQVLAAVAAAMNSRLMGH